MKQLMLVYLWMLLIMITGCTYTKTIYPTDEGDEAIVEVTDKMIRVQLNNGSEYYASGFKVAGDSLVLFAPISSERSDFEMAWDVIRESNGSSRRTEQLHARLTEMSLPMGAVDTIGKSEGDKSATGVGVAAGVVLLLSALVVIALGGGLFQTEE